MERFYSRFALFFQANCVVRIATFADMNTYIRWFLFGYGFSLSFALNHLVLVLISHNFAFILLRARVFLNCAKIELDRSKK